METSDTCIRSGPLSHIRVLDFSQTLAGPFASTILSDLGAEIIKVEKPGFGDQTRHFAPFYEGESHYFLSINRNKKSIAIDLKSEAGKQIIYDLIKKCDVLLENFRPGVMEKLGFGPKVIEELNPGMIQCSISAFGKTGPYGERAGYDIMVQAMSGVMSLTGEPDSPMRCGLPIGDLVGGLYGAISILGAIVEKQKTGKGLRADISLLDNLVSLLGYYAGKYYVTGESDQPIGSHHPFIVPYGTYQAKDGFMVLAVYTEDFWKKFTLAIDKPEWLTDPRFATNQQRVKNRDLLIDLVQQILIEKDISYWAPLFEKQDIPYSPILNVGQILGHPQIEARELVKKVEHPTYGSFQIVDSPVKYTNMDRNHPTPPPVLGEHTEEILKNLLSYTPEQIKKIITT